MKLVEGFFGHCGAVYEQNLPTNPFPGCTLGDLFSQVHNKRLQSSGMRRKQNFDFSLSLLPSLFAFLVSFFFQLAGHLEGFILVGRVSEKPFIILELGALGHLDADTYFKIYPTGSQPARIYGLPKMHKPRSPR